VKIAMPDIVARPDLSDNGPAVNQRYPDSALEMNVSSSAGMEEAITSCGQNRGLWLLEAWDRYSIGFIADAA
jgi:hypothetical protein